MAVIKLPGFSANFEILDTLYTFSMSEWTTKHISKK